MASQAADMDSMRPTKKSRVGERTMLACVPCKYRKLKCDGGSPQCENCTKNGRECLVEDPATGLHRPRNHMQNLESRVNYLEALLQRLHPDHQIEDAAWTYSGGLDHDWQSGSEQPDFLSSIASTSCSKTSARREEVANVDHLSSEVALLCLSAAGQEPRYFGPSSAVSFSHIASQTMGLRKAINASHARHNWDAIHHQPHNPRASFSNWPSPEHAERLTTVYFRNIHPQYPFLHRPTLLRWQQECRVSIKSPGLAISTSTPVFFVLMVYAIGSLSSNISQPGAAETYYKAALEHLEPVLELDGLESIQALLSIAVYSIRSPSGMSLWKVSGMAIRLCVQLGYHRNVEKYRRGGDPLSKEMSKRCFWVAYDLDRYVSCILGLPGAISDLSVDVEPPQLPLDVDDEDITTSSPFVTISDSSPTMMTGAIHCIKLRQIWSKFSTHLFPTSSLCGHDTSFHTRLSIEELRMELEEWRATAPVSSDQSQDCPLSVFASHSWFQLAYDHSILLLYRHYIMDTRPYKCGPPLPKTPEIVNRAFEECYAKSKDMCVLYRRLYQNPSIQFTWGSLHMLFFGGLTYLYCLWKSKSIREGTRQRDVVNTCMACQTVLVMIAERWKLATSYRDLFEKLSERTISMMCGDMNQDVPRADGSEDGLGENLDNPALFLQDWSTGFDGLDFPAESEWLVSELVQGVQESDPGDFFDFSDASLQYDASASSAQAFDLASDWDVAVS